MGAIADAVVAYTQPLLDGTDGSPEQLQKAMALGQLCWNLALLQPDQRDAAIGKLRSSMNLDDQEIAELRHDIIDPMIRRHEEMFPHMGSRAPSRTAGFPMAMPPRPTPLHTDGPRVGRNSPCPCGSGRKYKQCCGG
jgi:hypothetical protein